jgi:hypothetical protein
MARFPLTNMQAAMLLALGAPCLALQQHIGLSNLGRVFAINRIPDDYIGGDQRPRIHMLDFVSHTSSRSFGRVSWKVITLCQNMIRLDQLIQNCGNTCDRIVCSK